MDNEEDNDYMKAAFELANQALAAQEVPVGCVFVENSKIIAVGRNTVNETRNPTRHAEINCIDQVVDYCKKNHLHSDVVFKNIRVFVTVEPCIMCADALRIVGISEVVYGCANDRFGGTTVFGELNLHKNCYLQTGGVMADEALALLKLFYKGTNPMAPASKTKKKS